MSNTKYVKIASCIFFLMLSFGCNNNNKLAMSKIKSQVVISSSSLGYIRELVTNKGFLILLDKKPLNTDNQLRVYDLNSFRFIKSMGRIGAGPGEFRQGMSLNEINFNSGGFTLLDLSSYSILIYKHDDMEELKFFGDIKLTKGQPYMPIMINDTTIYSLCLNIMSGRFAKYNKYGDMVETLGDLPPGMKKDTPFPVYEQACKGLIRMTPDGNELIVGYQFANVIEIYNKEGDLQKRIFGETNKSPKYNFSIRDGYPTMLIDRDKALWGFIDIQVTDKNIIALFSGKSATENCESNIINVYDLNGVLKKRCELDRNISQIAIDSKNNKLLAIDFYSQPEVYSFNLSEILN